MENTADRAIAIVGVGAVLPDAADAKIFWSNVRDKRYSISEVRPERWDPAMYYDADHNATDKTYTKIGGWVREFAWDPIKWHLAIPPRVADSMDDSQKWAIACTREALRDYGYPERALNLDRTAVILGNAMGGERHYLTSLRIYFPEYAHELEESATFHALPAAMQRDITREFKQRIGQRLPAITEDTMPGELSNCIAGRVANVFNMHGPNFVCDAACASAMAAINAAVEGLVEHDFDFAVSGGIDRNMGPSIFVKFCKIGALSASGSRPYAEGADGFVMGEGAAIFLLKRLADAERDADPIYAVLRGMGGSSDGKGKGITAPNPAGQKLAIERAWQNAGLSPATATLFEGHGTSTRVGDVVEAQSLIEVLSRQALPAHSIALGSVKSNLGHLKAGAGAAGLLKLTMAIRDKVLPPSLNFEHPSPDIDFAHSPLYVNTELQPWTVSGDTVRRAGLSAFGFGGTNFHAVLEEYIPHKLTANGNGKHASVVQPPANGHVAQSEKATANSGAAPGASFDGAPAGNALKAPLRGALVIGGVSVSELAERLRASQKDSEAGRAPAPAAPAEADLTAPERIAIDYGDAAELADKCGKALKALVSNQAAVWKALRAQGIFRGQGPRPKVAFLYTGQGSQYVNMLRGLRAAEPIIDAAFAEADRIMTPLLGKPLSQFVFVDSSDAAAVAVAEEGLRQTAITQPAVLAADLAMTRLLAAYGVRPDLTMGHSLGEYGALVASGALGFEDALLAVSARGRQMTSVPFEDNGRMAAVFAPLNEIERLLKTVDGYIVIANHNSNSQVVIGGASAAVEQAIAVFLKAGYNAVPLTVSHAFHTSIVASVSEPLRQTLSQLHLEAPHLPVVANVNGEFYPQGSDVVPQMLDLLGRQVASPVLFSKGLHTLYDAGARLFVETGPKKALQGFVEDVLGDRADVVALFTNHPKVDDKAAFNQALCGLYAAGLGAGQAAQVPVTVAAVVSKTALPPRSEARAPRGTGSNYEELGRMFEDVLERGWQKLGGRDAPRVDAPVAITGAALGLPGTERIFSDDNVARILRGDQMIDVIPTRFRRAIVDKNITRLMKTENGGPTFELITDVADVIKLAGRGGALDLEHEFGISADRLAALDRFTQLAIGAGIDALRDAGIPLVMRYKTTTKGTQLSDGWMLPEAMRDDTGVIFASVFPGSDSFVQELTKYHQDRGRREQLAVLENLRDRAPAVNGNRSLVDEINRRIEELRTAIEKDPYIFDRRFLFRILSMGHSQFAEIIGARGPNTQVNSACASTTQAVSLAEDWIHRGRCRRVVVLSADDITSDNLIDWLGAGFLASGAAATDAKVEDAAVPFDRRRHGMIMGMGAAAMVLESEEAIRERGIRPICNLLGAVTANSAFHGTRLNVEHICQVMERLVAATEKRTGISRHELAQRMVFVSHETYTPARGGSSAAEVHALRQVFGADADSIVIANTKALTGHAMGTGIEDVVAVKALETGCVPPIVNFKEVDPDLGTLNLSKGGLYPIEYALRLAAGFGSQISMTLIRTAAGKDAKRPSPNALGYSYRIADQEVWTNWLREMTGYAAPDLEVVQRTLRVHDQGAKPRPLVNAAKVYTPRPLETPSPAPAATPASDPVKERILSLVAATTGYPIDMLALDLDLEADLGVDTVKQAEVFAQVRESFGIARDDKLKLRDFPTLGHMIGFVRERRPDLALKAPAAVVAAPVKPAPTAPAPAATDRVKDLLLGLVVEKTGYPRDMLDLDLDLEADLGVDTVKQAELFAAVREAFQIPRDAEVKLRDFPTLAHVLRFVYDRRPDLATAPAPAPVPTAMPAPPAAPMVAADSIQEKVLEIVAGKTGYPKDMLDLDLDLEADLGVDTVKQAEVFASVREAFQIPRDENLKLRDFPTLAHVIRFARGRRPDLAPPLVPPPAATADLIQEKVLEIVAAKTGYPKDMLDLDLDLEADLGVDTVKQAEVFSSVREAFKIPREENLKLRDFPTLAHVIQFARGKQTGMVAAPASSSQPALASLDATNQVPRRVPVPVLRPPLSMCKSTAVALGGGSRVVVMPDEGGTAAALGQRLAVLGAEVLLVENPRDPAAVVSQVEAWLSAGPIQGVYWLPALDDAGDLTAMDLPTWQSALSLRVKSLYTTMRTLYQQVMAPGTFLVAATRLGGQHGYDEAGATMPMGGAVTGFVKTYKRERSEALVKAVDFAPGRDAAEIADAIIAETLQDPGVVEIGYKGGERYGVGLEELRAEDGHTGLTLNRDTVFVITGAAGSIVSAITADLAAASGGTFHLLDLAPEPDPDNPDLDRFSTDKEGLKRDLFARIQARGERATPAMVERELAALERAHSARAAINAVRAAGGAAYYYSVDLKDAARVDTVIGEIRVQSGGIDVLLHAAGFERSHFLPDKDPREFDQVFDVKADGWFNLLRAIGDMPLKATVAFSSVAGRFGNAGQADYSAANDLLAKITSSFRTVRPLTRGIVIDWTAWGGIGMATRGSIPKMMELAGIDMLTPETGIPWIRRELTTGGTRGEVLVAGGLGVLLKEWDPTGGLDPIAAGRAQGPMIGSIQGIGLDGDLTIQTTLDPTAQPFLYDHQLDQIPVLPGVMGMEALAEAALCLLPGWHVEAVEDMNFLAPFKFYRNEPRLFTVHARLHPEGEGIVADCRLEGRRQLPNQTEPQVTVHFAGRVRLTRVVSAGESGPPPAASHGSYVEASDIYRIFFHGPAYQVIDRAWIDEEERVVGRMTENLPTHHQPGERLTVLQPRLIELCFQTAGLWDVADLNRLALPHRVERLRFCASPSTPEGRLFAVVVPDSAAASFRADVVDSAGNLYMQLNGYETVALPGGISGEPLKALHAGMVAAV